MGDDRKRIILPRDTEGEFKKFEEFWDEDGDLRDYYIPQPTNIDAAHFGGAFQLAIQCTPWTRRRSQWDLKLHFKKCRGATAMRKVSENMHKWTLKYKPNVRLPEKVCSVEADASPLYNDQYDVILLGVAGEQIEMVIDTILKMLKKVFS